MKILLNNKRTAHKYEILKEYEAGISLNGGEVKSLFNSEASIDEAFGIISNNEIFILNMYIKPYINATQGALLSTRRRKLLLNKNEIYQIASTINKKKLTLIPLNVHINKNKIKLTIAIARHMKVHDKRE
jgi:SsrA-binding protein